MRAFAELATTIPHDLTEEFVKRLTYVSQTISNPDLLPGARRVAFDVQPGFENRTDQVEAFIREIAEKLCLNYRPGRFTTLARRDKLPSSFSGDPHPLLEREGELTQTGRGRYAFGPKLVALMEVFDSQIRSIAAASGASAYSFPSLIGPDVLDRCQYFRNFPASLNLVSHLREDHRSLQQFSQSAHWDGTQLACDAGALSGVECLLSPAVCFHWYAQLRDSILPAPRAITAVGKCFRYESTNLTGLERLWDFTLREIIFVGTSQYVLARRDASVDACIRLLDDLGLAYEITGATDPFFVDTYAAQAAYQQGFDLKFELLLPLPYSGKKLAVGSINYHQDFFGRSFCIEASGVAAHTGCVGFGLERMALGFVAQYGVNDKCWPDVVTRHMRARNDA
jgi:seryl-tRNA synthetase